MRVLFLDLDTLRPDHLGCYGYHRNTSPNIDRIASEGVRFENYYCPDAPCLPSRAALVSGMFGIHNGAIGHGGTCADWRLQGPTRNFHSQMCDNSLWNVFRRNGMYTASISPFAERHSSYWFYSGFNEMHNHVGKGGCESAEEVTPRVMEWLERHSNEDNWLLHVNYWDPHTPYRAPEEFGNPFEKEPIPSWFTEDVLRRQHELAGPHTPRDNNMYDGAGFPQYPRHVGDISDMNELRRCIDGYDCGIRYMDGHIGNILKFLEEKGILEDTAIIVTSDHGENFGELGIYSEHGTADNITCRIPMIVRWPGAMKGHVDTGFHYNIDLAPTLAEVFGQQKRPNWDGQSYASSLLKGKDAGRDELILSQCAHVCQRSVRWDKWLYMRTYHDGFHPYFEKEMLFNLETDPHEQDNVASKYPQVTAEGASRLMAWHDEMMRTQPYGYTVDPMETVLAEDGPEHANARKLNARMAGYFDRLRATGRGEKIEEIAARHPLLADNAKEPVQK